ncbi:bifunctional oligoribonuclease/PAP phosphatase NrnA [Methanothermococcus sp. SCGC AD-155-E23]|nr:bifunctional oligoribonuclease/PAP phosphatase NrnA [Methanothermococcus sp. SCGC AD-155-E23]
MVRLKSEDINRLKKILQENKSILFLCHHNADPDAIGAAIALKYLAKVLNKSEDKTLVISADSISKLSKNILEEIGEEVEVVQYPKLLDVVFFVDTSNLNQVKVDTQELKSSTLVVIDHHKKTELSELCTLSIVDEGATSTCEIVSQIFREMGIYPPRDIRIALLCGILYDTKHLKLAREETFQIIAWLIRGINFQRILSLLTQEMDESKRMAHLKACSRMELREVGGYIVALSHVSSFEASCAKTIVSIGADVAFVVAVRKREGEIRVSGRCRKSLARKVHMGELMEEVARRLGGEGGGHREAAGLNARYDKSRSKEEVIREVLDLCYEIFKEKVVENSGS